MKELVSFYLLMHQMKELVSCYLLVLSFFLIQLFKKVMAQVRNFEKLLLFREFHLYNVVLYVKRLI